MATDVTHVNHMHFELKQAKPYVLLHRNYQVLLDLRSKTEGKHARSHHLITEREVAIVVADDTPITAAAAVRVPSCCIFVASRT